jgi:hypothetical protein
LVTLGLVLVLEPIWTISTLILLLHLVHSACND